MKNKQILKFSFTEWDPINRVSTQMYNEFLTSPFETNDVVHNKQIDNKKIVSL